MPNATQAQLTAAEKAAYALKATGPSPTADLTPYVAVIAQAVIDNEPFDRALVVATLRKHADDILADAQRALYWSDHAAKLKEQADLMEGGQG